MIDAPGAPLFETLADGDSDPARREPGVAQRDDADGGCRARRGDARTIARRAAGPRGRGARRLRRQHASPSPRRGGRPRRRDRLSAARDATARSPRLVIARGPGYKSDLRMVRPYIRDFRPGTDRGRRWRRRVDRGRAEAGPDRRRLRLDLGRSPPDEAQSWSCTPTTTARHPGPSVSGRSGSQYKTVAARGISEDLALELAHAKGAELIVAVGTHFNFVEFLERNREGMASTFITRLRVGEALVDAKGVSRLVSRRVDMWPLVAFAVIGPRRDRRRDSRFPCAAQRARLAQPRDFLDTLSVFDFRYHVASLAAVFVALVLGILAGIGLSGRGFVNDAERSVLHGQIDDLRSQRDAAVVALADANGRGAALDDFAETTYPTLARGRFATSMSRCCSSARSTRACPRRSRAPSGTPAAASPGCARSGCRSTRRRSRRRFRLRRAATTSPGAVGRRSAARSARSTSRAGRPHSGMPSPRRSSTSRTARQSLRSTRS